MDHVLIVSNMVMWSEIVLILSLTAEEEEASEEEDAEETLEKSIRIRKETKIMTFLT